MTGEDGWINTPAGNAWKPLFDRAQEGYRWAPEQVAKALVEAEKVIAVSAGRIGPGAVGSTFSGLVGSGSVSIKFQPHEVTWAHGVVLWPRMFLIEHEGRKDRAYAHLRLWLRKKSGAYVTEAEGKEYRDRIHRYHRKQAFLYIAAGLMRARVPVRVSGSDDGQSADPALHVEPSPPPPPSPAVWHHEEAEPVTYRHDESPEEMARLVSWIAQDVVAAVASGERRSVALVRIVGEVVAAEYANAEGDLRLDQSKRRRETKLMDLVMGHINAQEREERRRENAE